MLLDLLDDGHREGEPIKLVRLDIDRVVDSLVFKPGSDVAFPALFELAQDELVLGLPGGCRLQGDRSVPAESTHRLLALQVVLVDHVCA